MSGCYSMDELLRLRREGALLVPAVFRNTLCVNTSVNTTTDPRHGNDPDTPFYNEIRAT